MLEHSPQCSVQELFGLSEGQAQMRNVLGVLLQGDDVGDGFFLAIIVAHNELEFDAHGRAPLGFKWWVHDAGHSTGVRRLSPASQCSRNCPLAFTLCGLLCLGSAVLPYGLRPPLLTDRLVR